MPALAETPPGWEMDELLDLHALTERGARVQVAEQYAFQPLHAARLALVQSGRLGPVRQAHVSVAHGYHGVSLLRRFLGIGCATGLFAITRPNILLFVPLLLAWAVWFFHERGGYRPAAVRLSLILAGLGLVILPVTLRNWLVGGDPVLIASQGGVNFYIGNNPLSDGVTAVVPGTRYDWWGGYDDTHLIAQMELGRKLKEGEISDYWYKKSFRWILSEPGKWSSLMLRKLLLFWKTTELSNNKPIYFFAQFSPVSAIFWVGFPLVVTLGLAALIFLKQKWHT